MIVPRAIEAFHDRIAESLHLLKYNIDQTLKNIADRLGIRYVEARIKPQESLMAKIEKEGCKNPTDEIEDLVACRLIVKSNSDIEGIIENIREVFNIERGIFRSYRPNEFIYDDIQLILSFKDNPFISNKDILGKKFELQIRTGLQDALAEALREETYKTDVITWQKERTASELRANLELVDLVLSNFSKIASIQEEKAYKPYQQRNEIVKLLRDVWSPEKLPEDLRRASIIIEEYLKLAGASVEELSSLLSLNKHSHTVNAVSITPCQIILIVLFLEKAAFLRNVRKENRCLLITREMIDMCPKLEQIDQSCRVSID